MRAGRRPRLRAGLAIAAAGLGAFGIAIVGIVATASPAAAHAILESSDPADGTTVATSPAQITLTYNEPVEVQFDSLKLYDSQARFLQTGAAKHLGSAKVVGVTVPHLADGAYALVWRVISADSHPVQGTISFAVGSGGALSDAQRANLLKGIKGSRTVGIALGIARGIVFGGLALLIGGAVFLVLIARGTSAARRTRMLVWTGWVLLLLATVAALMLQGPYAEGASIGKAFTSSVVHATLKTRFGHITELRVLFLALTAILLVFLGRVSGTRRPPVAWLVSGGALALLLSATPGLAGHANTGDNVVFAVPLDTLHVAAMSIWFGGLVALIASALGGGFSGGLRRALGAFSRLAFWCVIVLVATGIFAAWRQVGFQVKGYTSTSYGNILDVKVAIVVGLVALAAVSRSIVRRRHSAPLDAPDSVIAAIDERTVAGLRKSVAAEVALGIAVLVATALLVNAQPARSVLLPTSFTDAHVAGTPPMRISVVVDPARRGFNVMHLYSQTPGGANLTVRSMSAVFTKPGADEIRVSLRRGGPNHFLYERVPFTERGKWTLTVHVLRGAFNDTVLQFTVRVR